jgi:hypothetical protein
MNLIKYAALKKAGVVELRKFGEEMQILKRKFDPETGDELAPEIQSVTAELIKQERTNFVACVEMCDEILADMEQMT